MTPQTTRYFARLFVVLIFVESIVAWKSFPSSRHAMKMSLKPVSSMHRIVPCGDNCMLVKIVYEPHPIGETNISKLPIVLFFSGADCSHESYMWLATRLAHEGYCVVLSSCVVSFGGSFTALISTPFDMSMLSTLQLYKQGPCSSGIRSILKQLEMLDSTIDNPLHGKLNLDCIVVGGHSSGGRTVLDLVSFDNEFPIKAAFSYGASLVVSNSMSGFAENGDIIPCDSANPPPLLLMGGSKDGISAGISATKDPTETLRRSVKEGFESANGDVDFIIFNGCNHMIFCSPVDPSCGAVRKDLPLAPDVESEAVRDIMGDVVCEFCNHHIQHNKLKFRPRIPSGLLHTAQSIRPSSSSAPEMSPVAPREQHHTKIWEQLSSTMDGWIAKIVSEFNLQSSDKLICDEWSSGNLTGSLRGWESDKVSWAVRYENGVVGEFSHSLGFNVWLSTSIDAPHLTIHVGVNGGKTKATIMGDFLPRHDAAVHFESVKPHGEIDEAQWKRQLCQGEKNGLKPFTSSDASIRAIQGPFSIAYSLPSFDSKVGFESLLDILNLHINNWLEMAIAAKPVPSELALAVGQRDQGLRQILLRHELAAGERFMDKQLAQSLAKSMAGYFETSD